ncbi:MAG: hypothetical protein AAF498_15975 [Pseudomonadota bacterium]
MRAFRRFAARDAAVLAVTVSAWILLGPLSTGTTIGADMAGAGLGLAAGICGWLIHEWGHLTVGTLAGAKFRAPDRLGSVYLFGFDKNENSKVQFLLMAAGGFAATAVCVWATLTLLPQDWMATSVLRGLLLLQVAIIALLELPGFIVGLFAYGRLPSVNVLGD